MTAKDLLNQLNLLDQDDLKKPLEAHILGCGSLHITDSLRFDFDGGRIIVATLDSGNYQQNKNNQEQELYFLGGRTNVRNK